MTLGLSKCGVSSVDVGGMGNEVRVWAVEGIPYLGKGVIDKYLGVKQHFGHSVRMN